jgi:hypothetical protein
MLGALLARVRRLEALTRPAEPEMLAALRRRWEELPGHVKHPAQLLGRRGVGCEGTHGVFPRCNLACTPCYHSREANRVRVDGAHTLAGVDRQLACLRARRGPRAFAQLIGGEVSLLSPEDHAAALQLMRAHGRESMSMSHGDFGWDYLRRLALGPDGRPRVARLSFAGHFDSLMLGRRGLPRPRSERELNPYRRRFCELFQRLERDHGVRHYLAHTMTVTPRNLGQVAQVIGDCRRMGFRMFAFQPAAFVGDQRRWREDYRTLTADLVWTEIERGAGARLPWQAIQVGDARCTAPPGACRWVTGGCRCWTTGSRPTWPPGTPSSPTSPVSTSAPPGRCWPPGWSGSPPATPTSCRWPCGGRDAWSAGPASGGCYGTAPGR